MIWQASLTLVLKKKIPCPVFDFSQKRDPARILHIKQLFGHILSLNLSQTFFNHSHQSRKVEKFKIFTRKTFTTLSFMLRSLKEAHRQLRRRYL